MTRYRTPNMIVRYACMPVLKTVPGNHEYIQLFQGTQALLPYGGTPEGPSGSISRHCEIVRGAATAPQMLYEAPCLFFFEGMEWNMASEQSNVSLASDTSSIPDRMSSAAALALPEMTPVCREPLAMTPSSSFPSEALRK